MKKLQLSDIFRWILGGVFTFSGVVKSVDPVGTSVFVEKYLATYLLDDLMHYALPIAIVLAVVEFSLGELLLSGRVHRFTAICATLFISIFTIITLLSATVLPIGDCGCFGDAVRLTPVQTLLKNIVMLPMAIFLWVKAKAERFNYFSLVVAVVISLGINLYALRYKPIIDFMPYRVGVNLRDEVERERALSDSQSGVKLVFRCVDSGEELLFEADDVACWTDDNLEYVGTQAVDNSATVDGSFAEFMISDSEGHDSTLKLLSMPDVKLLCIYDIEALERHLNRAKGVVDGGAVVLTSANMQHISELLGVECYTIDAMTLRSILRSRVGVVELHDGVITRKCDVRDF